jgi:hypothetical protein
MARSPDKHAARVELDQRGNPFREHEVQPGEFKRDLDTQRLRTLKADDLSLLETQRLLTPSFNPYDNVTRAGAPSRPARRKSLDDLRRLSEVIKRTRAAKKADCP